MKKFYLTAIALTASILASAQIQFDPEIDTTYSTDVVIVPGSPLITQYLFIGGTDMVECNATYGNPAGSYVAKEWHDFIGFTPDNSGNSLGWVTVNHEMIVQNDNIGDGGGMTAFRVTRDADNDTLIVMNQTLTDGRSGKFFAVDFVNTVGETGMNCGGITSTFDGRIWTAEEWFRRSNSDIADRDTSDFVIGTGTLNGQMVSNGFTDFDGDTIRKYQNVNWMVEVDPREAVAIRKQYNWGRQGFEGGTVLPDNKTVIMGEDATPGWLSKFVANTAGDFTDGNLYVWKHDSNPKWVQLDNTNLDNMLNYKDAAVAAGATMFNRIEWVVYSEETGKVYFTATGRDNPGGRWEDENADGAVHNPNTIARASAQGTHPDSSDYADYYGRIWELDPATDDMRVLLEGGPDLADGTPGSSYPDIHLTNPDGLGLITVGQKTYLIINEDLNGTSFGRVPSEISNRTCELFLLDLDITNPTINDLVRIAVIPTGAEVTGAMGTPDGKTILLNSQHPSTDNPFPYNHSLTVALTGWDQIPASVLERPNVEGEGLVMYPNPATRMLYFNGMQDIAIYDATGKRVRVERQVSSIDIVDMESGVYFVQNAQGETKKLIIE